jgi:transposase-like protein
VAQAEGVKWHQVFQWRRAFRAGGLMDRSKKTAELLPVVLTAQGAAGEGQADLNSQPRLGQAEPRGAIHIELAGRAMIRVDQSLEAAA